MTPRKLGRLAEVDLDSICLYENNDFSDFSRWLVDNPDLLGDALGLRLKIVQTQLAFGNLRQSILAEEAQGGKVAIEGYLDRANRTDQGRLLTYAAGCDAKYVVWVALRFTAEDRVTIDWLNRLGPDKVWFYGVEIRAVRIDDSLPAPYFRVVAAPKALHQGFFQPRIDDPGQECFAEDPQDYEEEDPEWNHDSGFDNVLYGAGVVGTRAYVWGYCRSSGSRDISDQIFGDLESGETLSADGYSLNGHWFWERLGNWHCFELDIDMEGSIDNPPGKPNEIWAWVLEKLPRLKGILDPRLEELLANIYA